MTLNPLNRNAIFYLDDLALEADHSGAVFIPLHKILIVADLHFEKAHSLSEKRGMSFPPFDSRDTLLRLKNIMKHYKPNRLICLGDTWHDARGPQRMQIADRKLFQEIITTCETQFVIGNHDQNITELDGLSFHKDIRIGAIALRHEPIENQDLFQICGHFHPVAKIKQKGRVIRRRCFYLTRKQCVLPALGSLTGGLNCLDEAFETFMSVEDRRVVVIGRDRLYHLGMARLITD